jgi:hypothetical protein
MYIYINICSDFQDRLAERVEDVAKQQQNNGTLVAKIEQSELSASTLLQHIAALEKQMKADAFAPPPWISSRSSLHADPHLQAPKIKKKISGLSTFSTLS